MQRPAECKNWEPPPAGYASARNQIWFQSAICWSVSNYYALSRRMNPRKERDFWTFSIDKKDESWPAAIDTRPARTLCVLLARLLFSSSSFPPMTVCAGLLLSRHVISTYSRGPAARMWISTHFFSLFLFSSWAAAAVAGWLESISTRPLFTAWYVVSRSIQAEWYFSFAEWLRSSTLGRAGKKRKKKRIDAKVLRASFSPCWSNQTETQTFSASAQNSSIPKYL